MYNLNIYTRTHPAAGGGALQLDQMQQMEQALQQLHVQPGGGGALDTVQNQNEIRGVCGACHKFVYDNQVCVKCVCVCVCVCVCMCVNIYTYIHIYTYTQCRIGSAASAARAMSHEFV